MIWAVLATCAAALGFAGTAVALAISGTKSKSEMFRQTALAKEAQYNVDELQDQLINLNRFRGADKKELNAKRKEIESLRTLLRKHAPDGAAASQFEFMLQEAARQNGDSDEDDSDQYAMSGRPPTET